MQQRGRSALLLRLCAFEVHGISTMPRPDVRTLQFLFWPDHEPVGPNVFKLTWILKKRWKFIDELGNNQTIDCTESTLHHLHEILQ
jgi:hypothetical protein